MADIDQANPSPLEREPTKHIDIKQAAAIQVQTVVATPTLTPALTPDEDDIDAMAGKKVFSLEKPYDRARELAAKLTLEEQVCELFRCLRPAELGPPAMPNTCS